LLIEDLNVWGILIQGYLTGLTGLTGSITFSVSRRNQEITILLSARKKAKETDFIVCSVMNTSASAGLVFPLSSGKGKRNS
jgi:hypothetical protein